ncbi:LamG-like jellyroll fold domain-containing protein [Roseospira navarrensis]|uniref:PKD domain-containing protein n=1 Tax=Roseospira navarrensis TaxID=140058 RepID=A0A7X1ZFF0_9PROT|nr:LamG-like jellyroll fold domain-containing protein [Roseospira navarrensis]MQX36240.1 hypothetical protein [Roseospira navarrensis]
MTTYHATNSEELNSIIEKIRGGETIILEGGHYGTLKLVGGKAPNLQNLSSTVTIVSEDPNNPATLSGLGIHDAINLTFDSIEFSYTFVEGDTSRTKPFSVTEAARIEFRNASFTGDVASGTGSHADGYGTGFGLNVRASRDVVIEDSTFDTFHRAAVFGQVDGLTVTGNTFSNMSSDGVNFAAVTGVLIEDNHFHDFRKHPDDPSHMDFIQFWTNGTTSPTTNVVIRGNILDRGDGDATQSIFMRNEVVDSQDGGYDMYYRNVLIENNVIHASQAHGITVGETDGLVIRNNTIVQSENGDTATVAIPKINANGESFNVSITGNIVPFPPVLQTRDPRSSLGDNYVTQAADPNAPHYVQSVFVDSLGGRTVSVPEDLQVLPGSPAAGYGASLTRFDARPDALTAAIHFQDNEVLTGEPMTFDASLSRGPGGPVSGDSAAFTWTIRDAEGTQVATQTGPRAAFVTEVPGLYTAELTVTGADGTQATNLTQVHVGDSVLMALDFQSGRIDDLSLYDGDGSAVSGAVFATVEGITALNLSETQGLNLDLGPNEHLYGLDGFTLDFGLRRAYALDGEGDIFRMHQSFTVSVTEKAEIAVWMATQDGQDVTIVTRGAALKNTDWHHVAVSYDSAAGELGIYVDGRLVGAGDISGTTLLRASWDPHIGNVWKGGALGYLSHLTLSANASDTADVRALDSAFDAYLTGAGASVPEVLTSAAAVADPVTPIDPVDPPRGTGQPETRFAFAADAYDPATVSLEGEAAVRTDADGSRSVHTADGYVRVRDDADMMGQDQLSVFFDVRADTVPGQEARLFWHHLNVGVILGDDGDLVFRFMDGDRQTVTVSDPGLTDGGWHRLGFSVDTDTGAFQAYMDGALIASETLRGVSLAETSDYEIWFGGTAWGRSLDGAVDNLAIYNAHVDRETAAVLSALTPWSAPSDVSGPGSLQAALSFDGVQALDGQGRAAATLEGGATMVRDAGGGADGPGYVDTTDGYVSFSDTSGLTGTDQLSVFFEFRTDAAPFEDARLFWHHMNMGVILGQDGDLAFTFLDGDRQTVTVSDPGVIDGQWHTVGFAVDATTGAFQAYLDGALVADEVLSGVSLVETSRYDLWLGGTDWGRSLSGDVGSLAIYDGFVGHDIADAVVAPVGGDGLIG